jgi:exonuclease VII small subunit
VWTQDREPLFWAQAQMNLGTALLRWGQRESGTVRLEQAVAAYRVALEELTRDRVPLDWAGALGNQGLALLDLAHRTRDLAQARQALDQLRRAEAVLREGGHVPSAASLSNQIPAAEALVAALAEGTT